MTSREPLPLVSVVITTKNEERNVGTCLESVRAQTYPAVEVIVVDNGSTDRTKEIALRYTAAVFDRGPQRGAQANYGMLSVAQGAYVMFVDADMILSASLIESCVRRMQRGDCVALRIPEVVLGRRFLSKVRRYERSFYDGTIIDAARFFLQDVIRRVGGFDEGLTMVDDWDLDRRIRQIGEVALLGVTSVDSAPTRVWTLTPFVQERGVAVDPCGTVIFHNESEFRVSRYLQKKSYYSNWLDDYATKWGRHDPEVRQQLGFFYRYVGVFTEDGKWRRLVSHPLLALGMYFLRLLVGAVYLWKFGSARVARRADRDRLSTAASPVTPPSRSRPDKRPRAS